MVTFFDIRPNLLQNAYDATELLVSQRKWSPDFVSALAKYQIALATLISIDRQVNMISLGHEAIGQPYKEYTLALTDATVQYVLLAKFF